MAKVKEKASDFVKQVVSASTKLPHVAEVVEHIISRFGGAGEFAKAFHDVYVQADSHATKARMLDSVLRMLELTAKMGMSEDPIETMSTEDLIDALCVLDKDKDKNDAEETEEAGV